MNYKELKKCLCCDHNNLLSVLNLTDQPLANSYKKKPSDLEDRYPLILNLCQDCFHTQLSIAINPDLMFKNYLYVSGTSKTLDDYSRDFAELVNNYYLNNNSYKPKNILDIACNDGTQLNHFKNLGIETYGIDPAENLYAISNSNHNVICDYYSHSKFECQFDLITAQNVFAHNSYPFEFLQSCKKDLSNNGLLFIQTSQANMILNNEFDTIYHEHLSFFNTNSMHHLAQRAGLNLVDVMKTNIHGTSYVFIFSKTLPQNTRVKEFLEQESNQGLYETNTYKNYAKNAYEIINNLKETINQYKNLNYHIVGYGAAAKANTLLNFGNITLDFIIDDNKLKQGLYTPGTGIEICDISILDTIPKKDNILFIPLAWNFYNEISGRIKKYRASSNDKYLRYFPELIVQ